MDQNKFALEIWITLNMHINMHKYMHSAYIFRANSPGRRYLMPSFNVLMYFTLWGSFWLAFAHILNKKKFVLSKLKNKQ